MKSINKLNLVIAIIGLLALASAIAYAGFDYAWWTTHGDMFGERVTSTSRGFALVILHAILIVCGFASIGAIDKFSYDAAWRAGWAEGHTAGTATATGIDLEEGEIIIDRAELLQMLTVMEERHCISSTGNRTPSSAQEIAQAQVALLWPLLGGR